MVEKMQHVLEGLGKHIKYLDLINCNTDRAGFLLLLIVQALVGNSDLPSLEHIILPHLVGPTYPILLIFFGALSACGASRRSAWIPLAKSFCNTIAPPSVSKSCFWQRKRIRQLAPLAILGATWEFEEFAAAMKLGDPGIPLVSGIRYNLKLNHFGRRVLDSAKYSVVFGPPFWFT